MRNILPAPSSSANQHEIVVDIYEFPSSGKIRYQTRELNSHPNILNLNLSHYFVHASLDELTSSELSFLTTKEFLTLVQRQREEVK